MSKFLFLVSFLVGIVSAGVISIENQKIFDEKIKTEDKLLVLDMYADWCMPCKMLAPTMEKLSDEYTDAVFYKINVDKLPDVSRAFRVSGIPYVVFFKNNTLLNALTGLQNETTYRSAIERFSAKNFLHTTSGILRGGIRVIKVSSLSDFKELYAYPNEKIKIVSSATKPINFSIKKINYSGAVKSGNSASFTVSDTGSYLITKNSGEKIGNFNVIEKMINEYNNISVKEASQFLKNDLVVLLDVRTDSEFNEGHIASANHFPLQTIKSDISKLEKFRGKPILLYCRSGNRSLQAAKILYNNGFESLFNMTGGITEWKKAGLEVIK